jgi:RND family efflux transporter MFP subunit
MTTAPKPRSRKLIGALALLAVCAGALSLLPKKAATSSKSALPSGPLTVAAASSQFLQEVLERGEVGSSSNVEIRCQVQSKVLTGTPIIQIVPEGTYVKEGDFLVKLDDSGIQADVVQQQIACNSSRALEVEARTDYEAAKLALEEYESGTFLQDLGLLEGEKFVAQENMRRAEEYLRYSLKLAERGYVTDVQLEADRFAVQKAKKELDNSSTKLSVLHRYTKTKTTNRLKANVETAEARLRARENSHTLDEERLKNLEDQLSKCVINAPTTGQVVYANLPTGEPLIAEGKPVRERQIIIRLPDPKRMQVTARINESRIDKVRIGMQSKIRLDAFPNIVLTGSVRSVSEYPLPALTPYSSVKEYGAEVTIDDPPLGVRSGMTAQVSIEVERQENVLQVPVQAVLERGKRFYCIVDSGGELVAREVQVGSANEQYVVISSGLEDGEQVILAPQSYESKVSLPDVASKEEAIKATTRKPIKVADNSRTP